MRFSTIHRTGRAAQIRLLGLSLLLTLLGMLLLTGAASAATCNDYWKGLGGDHDWATAANWSAGVPLASTNVCLDNTYVGGSYTVDIDTYNPALVANSITVGGSAGNLVTLAILGTGGGVDVGNTLTLSNQSAGGGVLSTGAITLGSLSAGQPGAIVVTSGTLVTTARSRPSRSPHRPLSTTTPSTRSTAALTTSARSPTTGTSAAVSATRARAARSTSVPTTALPSPPPLTRRASRRVAARSTTRAVFSRATASSLVVRARTPETRSC